MLKERVASDNLSEFLKYLSSMECSESTGDRLPSLADLSKELEISIASLREQLEVARALGLVEVRPKTGIRRLDYTFRPAVTQTLSYALAISPDHFKAFSDLRNHIEAAYWYQAVSTLTAEDHQKLRELILRAQTKLRGVPVQIPHAEHRELHLSIYQRLGNPFVTGILEAYWEMYEAVGLAVYTDFNYLEKVWQYHERMVEAIISGDYSTGFQALNEHADMLYQRSRPVSRQKFE
ncbi:MAG TPA: FCD domain-containing protein [Anaerolineaceae bacterium]